MDDLGGDIFEPEGDIDEVDRQNILDQTDLQMVLISTRRRARLKQADVDRLYGIDQSQLSDLERGRAANPRDSTLRRLAMAYASEIPGADAELIFQRMVEARERSSTQLTRESYDSARVLLRIELYSPQLQKSIWRMIDVLLDELDIVHRLVKKHSDDNDSTRVSDS